MDLKRTLNEQTRGLDLARASLGALDREPSQKLAWVNAFCILILLIGILGARFGGFSPKLPPPMQDSAPAVIEPPLPPPQNPTEIQPREERTEESPDAPHVVVVTPDAPSINFAVPTIGNLVVPDGIAKAPPLHPVQPVAPIRSAPANVANTGSSGDRPEPPYPPIAKSMGQQGTVTLSMTADPDGNIIDIEIKRSSGSSVLDRGSVDYLKRHWHLPKGTGNRVFETSINYKLISG